MSTIVKCDSTSHDDGIVPAAYTIDTVNKISATTSYDYCQDCFQVQVAKLVTVGGMKKADSYSGTTFYTLSRM